MDLSIKIDCQISDPHTEATILELLDLMLPWMADNVKIYSKVDERPRLQASVWLEYANGSTSEVYLKEVSIFERNGNIRFDPVEDLWTFKVKKKDGLLKRVVVKPEGLPSPFQGITADVIFNKPVRKGDTIQVYADRIDWS